MGLNPDSQVPPTRYNGIRTAEAILGTPLPILIGQHRASWKLGWYGDFTSQLAKQQGAGGSGLTKGGTQYVYSSSVVGFLCMGPCSNLLGVWDSIGKYAVQSETESIIVPNTSSFTVAGSLTSGAFTLGETVTQTGTGAHAVIFAAVGSILIGTVTGSPNGSGTWVGGTSGAVFTPTGTPVASASANQYVPSQQGIFASDLGTGWTQNYSVNANDYGSPGTVTLVGSQNLPLIYTTSPTPGLGHYTIIGLPTTPVYVFNSAQAGQAVLVSYIAYRYLIQTNENDIAGASVTVQYQTSFSKDLGVTYYPSGVALTVVSGTPAVAGTYNPNGGNYKFAPADFGLGVTINYQFKDPNTDTNAPNTLNMTFFGGALGQTPWSYLTSKHPSDALGYSEVAYVASSGLYLGYSAMLPQYNFEIAGPYAFGAGIPDANPADAIFGLLTNPSYKYNFPAANIDTSLLGLYRITGAVTSGAFIPTETVTQSTTGATATLYTAPTGSATMVTLLITGPADATHTWVGQSSGAVYTPTAAPSSSSARAQWTTNNFFISALLDSQTSLMSTIGTWCEAGQVFVAWDEGKLKFIPLVDTTCVANGMTFSPNTTPVIDLDDSDFVQSGNEDPINFKQQPWQNRWNRVNVRWSVRSNDYNEDILQTQDEGAVQQLGYLMSESPQDYQFLCTQNAAQFAANMRLQRYSAIYITYNFTLTSNFAFLSPGDIVTVTDGLLGTTGTMFGRTPVRITSMTDDPVMGIVIEAENFPWSVGAALINNVQSQNPSNTNDGPQQDPGNTVPIIFEVPNQTSQFTGGELYIFANGSNINWGGFQLYVSLNGTDYSFYGEFTNPARLGVTTLDLPTVQTQFTISSVAAASGGNTVYTGTITGGGSNAYAGNYFVTENFTMAANDSPKTGFLCVASSATTLTLANAAGVVDTTGLAVTVLPELDSTDTLTVNMQQSGAVLSSVTAADRDAFVTLSALVTPGIGSFSQQNTAAAGANLGVPSGGLSPIIAGAGVSHPNFPVGNVAWVNPNNVTSGVSYTTASLTSTIGLGSSTQILSTNGYGFALQSGAIVGGIEISFNLDTTDVAQIPLLLVGLQSSGGAGIIYFAGDGYAAPTPFTLAPTRVTLGSATNLWGLNPASIVSVINDPNFGACFTVMGVSGSTGICTLSINDVTITLFLAGALPVAWTNPNNVSSAVSFATATLVGTTTQWLGATGYGFALPFGFVLQGIEVIVNAQTSSGSANLGAILFDGDLQIGNEETVNITTTAGDVTLGSPTDLWFAQDFLDLDLLNASGFGVTLEVTGTPGVTVSIRNVRMKLFGTSAQNMELISYENAVLTGQNTYQLTSLRRGVLGSYPCDHPSGATFARMDQATLTYEYDASYKGKTIYFKFLSFNAYGNQLQSLGNVTPYAFELIGLSPGAIDPLLGSLLTGTPNYSIAQHEAVVGAAHGPFGITNIPPGFAWMGPTGGSAGLPGWVSLDGTNGPAAPGVNDMYIYIPTTAGTYGPSQELFFSTPVRNITLPVALAGTHAGCRGAPTGSVTVSMLKNGVSFGTINIAAGATTATYTMTAAVSFNGTTDTFSLSAPASPDATFSGFWVNFYASRSN
jgi:Putative phage tail protein